MTFASGEDTAIEVPGPARLEWGEQRLAVEGGITAGSVRGEGGERTGSFRAWEQVVLTRADGARLATPELEARFVRTAEPDAVTTMHATARGPARVDATTRDGEAFTLATAGDLGFEQTGESWRIPLAEEVELEVHGPEGFRAVAGRVTDFEPEGRTFEAEGAVEVRGRREGREYTVRGPRLSASGAESFELRGTAGERVSFEHELGSGSALAVEVEGDTLSAAGDVEAELRREELVLELTCDRLDGRRTEELLGEERGAPDGPPVKVVRARTLALATGNVRATGTAPGREYDLFARTVELGRDETRAGDEVREAATRLFATDVERGVVRLLETEEPQAPGQPGDPEAPGDPEDRAAAGPAGSGTWQLRCAELEGAYREGPGGVFLDESLEARGAVQVDMETEAGDVVVARGDRLTLGLDGIGRLERTGARPVSIEGTLAGVELPFSLDADWAELGGELIRAGQPDIEVVQILPAAPAVQGEGGAPAVRRRPVRARASELSGTFASLLLSGDVEVQGALAEDRSWTLRSAFARIEGQRGKAGGPEGTPAQDSPEPGGLRSLHAWGGFEFELGAGLRATGSTLTAVSDAGRLYIEGEPARLRAAGLTVEGSAIEYDLVHGTWRSGPGSMGPARAAQPELTGDGPAGDGPP